MDRLNIQHIQEKLHIDESVIVEMCSSPMEDDLVLTAKETKHLVKVAQEIAFMFDYDDMVSKLLDRRLCSDAFNYIDYSMDSEKRIYKVNVGLWSDGKFEIEETSVTPTIFIEILTDVTALHITKRPEEEKRLKQQFLQLLGFHENNTI